MREKNRGKAREERGYRDSQGKDGKERSKQGEGVLRSNEGATVEEGKRVSRMGVQKRRQQKKEAGRESGERQSVRQRGRQRNKGRREGEKWKRSRKRAEVGKPVRRSLKVTRKKERGMRGASDMGGDQEARTGRSEGVPQEGSVHEERGSVRTTRKSEEGKKGGVDGMRCKTEAALERRKPIRETKGRKKGGTIRQIPVGVNTKRGQYRVGKWFRNGVRSGRKSTSEGSGKALRVERAAVVGMRSKTPKGGAEVVGTQRKGSTQKQRKSPKQN